MPGIFEANRLHDHFRVILSEGFFGSWSGVIFRSVSPRYARATDIVSGYGSYCAGGRWNAPGIYAIYGSVEPGLAADESFNFLLQHFGWQNRDIPPRAAPCLKQFYKRLAVRDSEGVWDGINWDGEHASFFALRETEEGRAREKLLARCK